MAKSYNKFPTVEFKEGEKTLKRYKDYPRLNPEEADAIYNSRDAPPKIDEMGNWKTPTYLIVDASKAILIERWSPKDVSSAGIPQDLQAAQKKLGAPASSSAYRDFIKAARSIAEPLNAGELGKAVKALAALEQIKGLSDAMKKEADVIREKVNAEGEAKLAEAEEKAGSDKTAAKEILQKLAADFAGHPLEKKVQEQLKKLQ